MREKTFDILIIGAGLSGLLTAYSLSQKGLNIGIIDQTDFNNLNKKEIDFRTTAVSEGSKIYFEKIDFWRKISNFAEPIKQIKVFNRNKISKINFENPEKKSYLGYVILNAKIKKTLVKNLRNSKYVKLFPNTPLEEIDINNNFVKIKAKNNIFKSKLLIASDGKNSYVRKITKTTQFKKTYKQIALVINLNHNKNHKNIAHEIFSKLGPLAILPMKSQLKNYFSSSVIWSDEPEYINSLTSVNENHFKLMLEEKLFDYLGNIISIINKKSFNLSAHINSSFYKERLIFLGDAAHSIHPIAGQGWNLGVKDIENLSIALEDGLNLGLDIGDKYICKKYNYLSFQKAFMLYQITNNLNSIFLHENILINMFRSVGFNLIEKNRNIKNFISSFAMGKSNII